MENEEENIIENEKMVRNEYGNFFSTQFPTGEEKYYDIIIDIDSITKLFKDGWDIIYTEKGEKNYESNKFKKNTTIGIIGRQNSGKSFILEKITGHKLPLGNSVPTKGISVLYPHNIDENLVLIDSIGLDNPLIEKPGIYEFEILDIEKKKKFEDELKSLNEKIKKSLEDIERYKNEKVELERFENLKIMKKELLLSKKKNLINFKDKGIQIKKFTQDKNITDYFIQKFIIYNSNILILVVNYLTIEEQVFINKIIDFLSISEYKKNLLILHNLNMFIEKKQIEDYIWKYIDGNKYFNLQKKQIIKEENLNGNNFYWIENKINENNINYKIIHLIMANDDEYSEAGDYYNKSTMNFIKNYIRSNIIIEDFNILERTKNFIFEISNEILETKIERDDIVVENYNIRLKIWDNKNIKLKDSEELNINFHKLNYRIYIITNEEENLLCIEVEIPGIIEELFQTLEKNIGKCVIILNIKKKIKNNDKKKDYKYDKDKEFDNKDEKKDYKYDKDKEFEYIILKEKIKFHLDKYFIEKFLSDKVENERGIYKLYYSLKELKKEENIEDNEKSIDEIIFEEKDSEDEEDGKKSDTSYDDDDNEKSDDDNDNRDINNDDSDEEYSDDDNNLEREDH